MSSSRFPWKLKGGETESSNSFAAYEALPANITAQIVPLQMVRAFINGRRLVREMRPLTMAEQEALPRPAIPLLACTRSGMAVYSLFFSGNVV